MHIRARTTPTAQANRKRRQSGVDRYSHTADPYPAHIPASRASARLPFSFGSHYSEAIDFRHDPRSAIEMTASCAVSTTLAATNRNYYS